MRFDEQFQAIQPAAINFARSKLAHKSDAEDAVQTAAVKAISAYSGYDPNRPFKAWFFTILRNCCLDRLRQRRRDPERFDEAVTQQSDHLSLDIERSQDVKTTIALLKPAHQEILRLRYFAEMSYADMADYLDIPAGTVMSRLHAARLAFAAQHEKLS